MIPNISHTRLFQILAQWGGTGQWVKISLNECISTVFHRPLKCIKTIAYSAVKLNFYIYNKYVGWGWSLSAVLKLFLNVKIYAPN